MQSIRQVCAVVALCATATVAIADEVHVAVAANFTAPAKELAPMFEKQTGHKLVLSFGGTGMFYGQIKNGAPFDVLLAADAKTPKKALKEGYGVPGSSFTYAVGKLVLWSANADKVPADGGKLLASGQFNKCAVANPKLAPYGLAAHEALKALGLFDQVKPKFVEGDNIGKTFNFVKTGNADIGLVALSQVFKNGKLQSGSGWMVPENLYAPIKQDAVLLKQGKSQKAAQQFLEFLQGPQAAEVKKAYGYGSL